jgi:hypothetical protein
VLGSGLAKADPPSKESYLQSKDQETEVKRNETFHGCLMLQAETTGMEVQEEEEEEDRAKIFRLTHRRTLGLPFEG